MISSMVPWHRILGLALTDLFTGSPFEVEMEKDLSARKQLLDIAVVRKTGPVPASLILPDGLEGLSDFNLFTYNTTMESRPGTGLGSTTSRGFSPPCA